MIYLFLADGFEELEAVAPIDLIRRAGKEVLTVGVGGKNITGRNKITLIADIEESDVVLGHGLEMIILPGGLPGFDNLYASEKVREAVTYCAGNGIFIAAICAAPSIPGRMGLLKGIKATCYPGFEDKLANAAATGENVTVDGCFITAKSAGVSLQFGMKLVEILCGEAAMTQLTDAIRYE
jgi:4-methyl-5(b-hydroxyethyl)-thiazole monophosphate biosynthesis